MVDDIGTVFRDFNNINDPASGEYEPEKPRIRGLLRSIRNSSGLAVTRNTLAALTAVTPPTEDYMGVVLDDPDPSNNGYYSRVAAAWVWERGFPDTFARVTLGGTANVQTGSVSAGVDPASIEVFFATVGTDNTGPMTLSVDGETARDVVNAAGNALSAGEWTGVVLFFLNENGDYQLLIDAGAAAAAAASASAADADRIAAELARDQAQAAASSVSPTEFPDIATAEALSPASAPDFIRTAGYASAGDGGAALYKKVASEPSHAGKFSITLDDGVTVVWYEIASSPLPAGAFGAIGDGTVSQADMLTACTNLWNAALDLERDMYFPAGLYEIGDSNFPFRNPSNTPLLDCGNITIFGDGDLTVFRTNSPDGADAFQVNAVKNLHFKNFQVNPILTGFAGSGSNGFSFTNGSDGITIDNILVLNAPSVDATSFVDGGKAFSIQPATTTNECGSIRITNCRAVGCAYGFGMDINLVTMDAKRNSIQVLGFEAQDCFRAVVISGGAATSALTEDFDLGVTIQGHAINCQQDIFIARGHGINIDMTLVTTKTAAERRLDPNGTAWLASTTTVEALLATYAHQSVIRIRGNKGECDYKARIGGTTAGSSGLTGASLGSYFDLDIGGVAATGDIVAVNAGGLIATNCVFAISLRTTNEAGVDALLKNATYGNLFDFAGTLRMVSPKVAEALILAFGSDGVTETGRIALFGSVTGLQGKGTSVANSPVTGLYDNAGNLRFAARNGPGFVVNSLSDATASTGSHVGRLILYNASNVAIGAIDVNTV